jgi:hypothetical protein
MVSRASLPEVAGLVGLEDESVETLELALCGALVRRQAVTAAVGGIGGCRRQQLEAKKGWEYVRGYILTELERLGCHLQVAEHKQESRLEQEQ